MTETTEAAHARYLKAAHAMQSGVAMKMNFDTTETEPKQLRTGINSAMVEFSALIKLLTTKGILSEGEFMIALADAMEAEKQSYEKMLSEHFGGKDITLS